MDGCVISGTLPPSSKCRRSAAHGNSAALVCLFASKDQELHPLLHHILIAHRLWPHVSQGLPFSVKAENVVPATLDGIIMGYKETQAQQNTWLERLEESGLIRTVESPYLPNRIVTVREARLQVCLLVKGTVPKCATRLRRLGGKRPSSDYITLVERAPWS